MQKKQQKFSDEEIRKKILEYLNSIRMKARSLSSIAVTITKIKSKLKSLGISQNEVVRNLDFLVQHGWVIEKIDKRVYKSPNGFEFPSENRVYKLSDLGINYFEGPSQFTHTSRFAGININNLSGVVVLGNNNIVRTEYIDLFKKLEQLENAAKLSDKLNTEEKLNMQADIQVIKDQLTKSNPNKAMIQKAMESISFLGSIPGMMELFQLVKKGVEELFK